VDLMTSTVPTPDQSGRMINTRMPHPQVHMNYIASGTQQRVWGFKVINNISFASNFAFPYVVFFPILSSSGGPFPTNVNVREIQGRGFRENQAWRGDIIVAKYSDHPFGAVINLAMSDYPLLKNWFLTHGPYDR